MMPITLNPTWDLSIHNPNGQLTLVVEIKRKINTSPEWATQLRHNLLAHGTFPQAPYFLLVFPDKFYLWKNPETPLNQSQTAPPTYTIDAGPILQPYFERAEVTAQHISPESLQLIVTSWLGEIIHTQSLPENLATSQSWLIESGLYAALAGGKFEHEVAA